MKIQNAYKKKNCTAVFAYCCNSLCYELIFGRSIGSSKSLLVLASTIILGSGSRGTHGHIFLSHDFVLNYILKQYAMKACGGVEVYSTILDVDTRWR
jgi:hypothetical protein